MILDRENDLHTLIGVVLRIESLLEKQEERMTRAEPCERDECCEGDEFRKLQIFVDQLNSRTRTLANEIYGGQVAEKLKQHSDLIGQLMDSCDVSTKRRLTGLENSMDEGAKLMESLGRLRVRLDAMENQMTFVNERACDRSMKIERDLEQTFKLVGELSTQVQYMSERMDEKADKEDTS